MTTTAPNPDTASSTRVGAKRTDDRIPAEGTDRLFTTRTWVDVAVVLVLGVLGMAGFTTSFDSPDYLLAGFGGLAVGAIVALVAAWQRFGVLLTAAAAIVGYYLLGSALAFPQAATGFVLPNIDTLADLTVGPVLGWVDILTLRPPVSLPSYVNAVPYVAGWLVALIGVTLVVRWTPSRRTVALRAALVLIGPAALYVTGVLLGTDRPVLAAVRGVAFGVIALIWLGWHRSQSTRVALSASRVVLRRRLLGTAAVVAAGAVLGAGSGLLLAPPPEDRFVLREEIIPPFEPLDYPSPLSGFRSYTKDLTDTQLLRVEGMTAGQRIRLASMDTYDGVLWGVAGAEEALDGSGAFQLVGSDFPRPVTQSGEGVAELDIDVLGYDDVWVPEIGYLRSVSFDEGADADLANVRYNAATGTTVLTSGLDEGINYTIDAQLQDAPATEALVETPTASFAPASVTEIPDQVAALAQELTAEAESPAEKAQAITDYLTTTGFYSRGTATDQAPSRAGHGADRMADMVALPDMVGDEEQYSSLFALMVRSLGMPVRVVMGFAPEIEAGQTGPVDITGDDVSAWAEIAYEGVGWVPYYPTPDNIDVPQNQVPKPRTEPQPQVRQPPRSDAEQDDLVSPVEIDESDDEDDIFGIPAWVWVLAA
ncbi:MAG: transglutaminase-like domain-containing protein, partial [Microbacteriaceae bacterium]